MIELVAGSCHFASVSTLSASASEVMDDFCWVPVTQFNEDCMVIYDAKTVKKFAVVRRIVLAYMKIDRISEVASDGE